MKTKTINKDKAKELINQSNGRIFSSIFDMLNKGYRMINLDTLQTLIIDKRMYTIEQ